MISIRQFNKNISKVLKEVATTGKSVTIEKYGKPYIILNVATSIDNSCNKTGKISQVVATSQYQPTGSTAKDDVNLQVQGKSTKQPTGSKPYKQYTETDPIMATIQEAKQKKAEVIQALKDKTEDILKPQEVIEKHYCLQYKRGRELAGV